MRSLLELTEPSNAQVQARRWPVGPGKTKTRDGQHDRYFACHRFQFNEARFVKLSGDEMTKDEREADLADIEEGSEEDEDEMETEQDLDEESREAALREQLLAQVAEQKSWASQSIETTMLDTPGAGGEVGTAVQTNTPGLAELQQSEAAKKFKEALPGAYVKARCYVAEWQGRRGGGGGRGGGQNKSGQEGSGGGPGESTSTPPAARG